MKNVVGALDRARITVAVRKSFHRDRAPVELKVTALLAYFSGASFRRISRVILHGAISPEAVRQWWNRLSHLFFYLRGPHGVIVVDETFIEIRGEPHCLWVAINAKTLEVIHLRLAKWQNSADCREFLGETLGKSQCFRPVFLHDRGLWYTHQSNKLDLAHFEVRGGLRSRIECWNRQFKHRLDGFWRTWPWNTRNEQADQWIRSYAWVWNLTRA